MTKTDQGLTVRLNVKLDHASVWLQVRRPTKLESEAVYRKLLVHRKDIERAFPDEMGWDERKPGEWDSLLIWGWANRKYGLKDREHWSTVQQDLVDAATALVRAVLPYLPSTRWSVHE